jgi:hypothetical protein
MGKVSYCLAFCPGSPPGLPIEAPLLHNLNTYFLLGDFPLGASDRGERVRARAFPPPNRCCSSPPPAATPCDSGGLIRVLAGCLGRVATLGGRDGGGDADAPPGPPRGLQLADQGVSAPAGPARRPHGHRPAHRRGEWGCTEIEASRALKLLAGCRQKCKGHSPHGRVLGRRHFQTTPTHSCPPPRPPSPFQSVVLTSVAPARQPPTREYLTKRAEDAALADLPQGRATDKWAPTGLEKKIIHVLDDEVSPWAAVLTVKTPVQRC